jgi:hypothetical protein
MRSDWKSDGEAQRLQCMGHLVQYHPVNSYSIHKIGRYQIDSWPGFCFAFHWIFKMASRF